MRKNILLVEDEAIIALAEKSDLEKQGFNVSIAKNGEIAVTIIQSKRNIDLVLMDINLGSGMDGTKTAEIILKERDLPIVFLSNHNEPEIVNKTEAITSYGYVVKNTGITVLAASIKMAFKLYYEKKKVQKKEKVLREKSNFLKLAMQNAHIGTFEWILAPDTVSWSNELLRIFGTTRKDFGGNYEAYLNFIPISTRDNIDKKIRDFIASPSTSRILVYEHEIIRADGKPCWLEIRATLFLDSENNPLRFSGIAIDISSKHTN